MKHFRYLLAGLGAVMFVGAPAMACSCLGFETAEQQMSAVDLVFEGQVINIAQEKDRRSFWQRITGKRVTRRTITTFQVNRPIKGKPGRNIAIVHMSGEHSASCGTSFPTGRPLVVLAYKSFEGEYGTSLCTQAQFALDDYVAASQLADAPE